ncbi:TlpA family protein disulfide reductase [Roseimaritima sediminicola]|uniref:TlpA family protein disulfide reductase n=1 Tax=Roseimaritima sediminicola TaxID=2662066 RepID=UPI0012982EE3|nr:TlpA disulfide reductase family protein [Roseimaritima sediminicola]
MALRRLLSYLGLAALTFSLGCSPEEPVVVDPETTDAPATVEEAADAATDDDTQADAAVQPELAAFDEIQQRIAELDRPAVVDYWSLACQPCMDEFPGLVRLHREHGERVACVAVDVDFDGRKSKPPESYKEAVSEFLTEQAAEFPNYLSTTPSDEVFAALEIISIPSVFVYNADGTVAKKFVDAGDTAGFTYEDDVIPYVKEMLASGE